MYGDSHVTDKTVARHGYAYMGNTTSLYFNGAQISYLGRYPPIPICFGLSEFRESTIHNRHVRLTERIGTLPDICARVEQY